MNKEFFVVVFLYFSGDSKKKQHGKLPRAPDRGKGHTSWGGQRACLRVFCDAGLAHRNGGEDVEREWVEKFRDGEYIELIKGK